MMSTNSLPFTQPSSLFSGHFWTLLKEEAAAVSWNLRDARRHGIVGEAKPSVDRAIASAERLVTLVGERVEAQLKRAAERRAANIPIRAEPKQDAEV